MRDSRNILTQEEYDVNNYLCGINNTIGGHGPSGGEWMKRKGLSERRSNRERTGKRQEVTPRAPRPDAESTEIAATEKEKEEKSRRRTSKEPV